MKHSRSIFTFKNGPLALVVPLTFLSLTAVPLNLEALPLVEGVTKIAAEDVLISGATKLNPTTVEIAYRDGQHLTIDFYGENVFRLFRDDNGGIIRDPQATPPARILTASPRRATMGVELKTDDKCVTIKTRSVTISFDRSYGLMTLVRNEDGKKVLETLEPVSFDKGEARLTFKAEPDEYFYGGGVQNGRFSHKGKKIAIENTNNWVDGGVASPTPFYWSTKGYGLLWHTFKPGAYDFGESAPDFVKLSHKEDYLDVFLMVEKDPIDLLGDFYQLTGNPVLLPKFGFYQGHLNAYNRDYWKEAKDGFMAYEDGKRYNESQKDNGGVKESLNGEKDNYQFSARAAVDRYFRNDMPLGWFLPNDGYGAGYGQTETLDGNIQNLREFGDYARSKGVEIGLWTQSDLHPKEGVEALLQRDIVKEVRDAGVRVLKTDVAWVGAGYSFGLNGVSDVGEIMPYYGNNARPFIISLDGWAGTQRYAGIWSGDQTGGDWEYIRFHIPTFIGSGLSGQPNISSDTDGIFGGKNVPVNVREFQWKTFTPMELNMDGWGATPKYPEALGEPATSINRSYLKLKSELMPYTYTIARTAVDGKPMVRAMFLESPNEYTLGQATQYQFMYGPYFLVAPIYQATRIDDKGNDIRNGIYLPDGGLWVDYYSGDTYRGGRIINNYEAPLWKLPVFVKSDAIIPMTSAHNNPTEIKKDFRAYEIYADSAANFVEYDDDGRTQAYLDGQSVRTAISTEVKGGKLTVNISPTVGEYEGFVAEKQTELRVNVSREPKKVTAVLGEKKKINLTRVTDRAAYDKGENVVFYDAAPNLNRYSTPGTPAADVVVTKNPQLLVKLASVDTRSVTVSVKIDDFEFAPEDRLLTHTGTLVAPKARVADEDITAFTAAPSWEAVPGADYYEVDFDGMRYSTIKDCTFTFEGLQPETAYDFKVRAVNRSGESEWAAVNAVTKSNPLQFALKGLRARLTCEDQPGSGVASLFDFDEKSMWHTKWGATAVPFDMTIDLRSVNKLDRLEYIPREDGGNGTITKGTFAFSTDGRNWSKPEAFEWSRDGVTKGLSFVKFGKAPEARYVKLSVTEAVGNFGSGRELYVFKQPGTESLIQGDINRDKKLDDGDLTSYMNYTGLRRGDSDFQYVSIGDINDNGVIDAYDISCVATELDGGVRNDNEQVAGSLKLTADKKQYAAGETVTITVDGIGLHRVNALGFALPYSVNDLEFIGVEPIGMKEMVNLTNDRLHTDGSKVLYPTFVNRGNNFLLEEGDSKLFVLKFRARRAYKFNLKAENGILVDRNLGEATF